MQSGNDCFSAESTIYSQNLDFLGNHVPQKYFEKAKKNFKDHTKDHTSNLYNFINFLP